MITDKKETIREKKETIKKKIDESQTIEKGKKGLFGVIYGRTAVIFLLLFLQILLLLVVYQYLQDKGVLLNGVLKILAAILVIHIVNRRDNPAFMISWIVLILGWPVFGALLYLFV